MKGNIFHGVENIDAEYMERWLGGNKIESLSPKTLYDIQSLIRHYSDIIVPHKEVKISFPTEEDSCPRASVDSGEVMIPTDSLLEGRVDETIGSMIHELHHIKLSDGESKIWSLCFHFVCKILDTLFIEKKDGSYSSLKDIVFSDHTIDFEDIMSKSPKNPNAQFLRTACDDVAFLLNAVEDVRIDANTPPNLKKYLDKVVDRVSETFVPEYNNGKVKENTLINVSFKLLFHHKGKISDPYISSKFPDTDAIINSTPTENTKRVFSSFKDDIRTHIETLYSAPQEGGTSLQNLQATGTDVMDMYLSEKTADNIEDDLKQDIAKRDSITAEKAEELFGDIEFEDKEMGDETPKFSKNSNTTTEEIKEEGGKNLPILTKSEIIEIDSFAKLKIYHTKEILGHREREVEYSCAIFDATK
tara:strand:- start:5695 stop:6942 length:1248 start_codon:yes stop_codon:yes gene_type:complete